MLLEGSHGSDRKEKEMISNIKDCFHCAYGDFDTTEEPCNRCLLSKEIYACWKSPEELRGQMTFDELIGLGGNT